MPTAIGRGRAAWGNRKPPATARVDWSHPLARELRLQYLFNEGCTGAGPTATGVIRDACRGLPATPIVGGTGVGGNFYVPALVGPGRWNARAIQVWNSSGGIGRIAVANDPCYKPTAALTIMAWHLPAAGGGNYPTLLSIDYRNDGSWSSPNICYYLLAGFGTSLTPFFAIATAGGVLRSLQSPTVAGGLNLWTHYCGTYDGAAMRLYANGDLLASAAASGPIDYGNDGPLCLGDLSARAALPSPSQVAQGPIEDVRVYGRALSPAEIRRCLLDPFAHLIPAGPVPGPRRPAAAPAYPPIGSPLVA